MKMVVPYFMDYRTGYSFGDDDSGIHFDYEETEDKKYLVIFKRKSSPTGWINSPLTIFSKAKEAKAKEFCKKKLIEIVGEEKFNLHENMGWIRKQA